MSRKTCWKWLFCPIVSQLQRQHIPCILTLISKGLLTTWHHLFFLECYFVCVVNARACTSIQSHKYLGVGPKLKHEEIISCIILWTHSLWMLCTPHFLFAFFHRVVNGGLFISEIKRVYINTLWRTLSSKAYNHYLFRSAYNGIW